jgi:hypothetical protein
MNRQARARAGITEGAGVVGAGFMRNRMEAPGLRPLDAGQLTELLTPAVQALLDTAPRQA